ncbi:MAG: glycosyltransferase family 4 protein [candidate division NC10 bacterium]|nr:glycosyltransferase family 4 protein [candidate division NC10 bacterium]MDE2322842.1 glycosyltransferase family 4 protein [candidate division NC10 bacterium]
MRALHIFPFFGPDLIHGAEYHEYMLSKKLVEVGVEVDVLTTRSKKAEPTSAFSLKWVNEYDEGFEKADDIDIYRFPATFSIPAAMGHVISRLMFRRWQREEGRYGIMIKGSKNLIDYYFQRAVTRPFIYDWLSLLGRGPFSFPLLARIIRSIKRYDVLLVGFMPFAMIWQITHIARVFKKPVVILALFHPDDIYHHFRAYYRCFSKADAILAQTPYSAELFRRLFPGSKPIQVGPGVDDKVFTDPGISGECFRAKYGLVGKKIILFVGRKEPSKRYDLAIEAIDLIDDERVKLVMVGNDVDRKPILSSNVLYLGKVPRGDLLNAYDACDVFLLPSEYESFGMVFLEAWMRKKPVIGNAFCKSVASVIEDGEDGYLCASAEEIAERSAWLISNPALAKRLGEAGYKKVVEHHTWDVVGRNVYDLYGQIVGGSWPASNAQAEMSRSDCIHRGVRGSVQKSFSSGSGLGSTTAVLLPPTAQIIQ